MSCYHPIAGYPDFSSVTDNGKRVYKLNGRYDPELKRIDPYYISIPCGRCIGCRLDYSRAWADRMMLELDHSKKAVFLTLTYDNDHVPFTEQEYTGEFGCFSLNKRDLQLFFKRLRKQFKGYEIRFYAVGEYGTNTFRPHYHAIVFGLGLEDFRDRKLLGSNELGQPHFKSDYLASIWQNGFCVIADVSWETMAYVSRYVQKKVYAGYNFLTDQFDAVPEFSLMSRRPGIGGYYMQDHPELFDYSVIHVKGCPKDIQIPRYFMKKLELTEPDLFAKIQDERKKFSEDHILLKMQQTDLSFLEQLEVEENDKLMRTAVLKRFL